MTLLSPNACSPYSLFPGCQRAPVRQGCAQAAAVREDSALSVPRPACVPSGWKLHPPTLPSHGGPPGPLANRSWHVGARGPKGRPFRAVASVGYPSAVLPLQPDHKGADRGSVGSESNKGVGRATAARLLPPSQTLVLGSESNKGVGRAIAARLLPPSQILVLIHSRMQRGAGNVLRGRRCSKTPSPPRTTDVAVVPRPLT